MGEKTEGGRPPAKLTVAKLTVGKLTVAISVLVMLIVVNERSAATREQSLRTSDSTAYVERLSSNELDVASPSVVAPLTPDTAVTTTAPLLTVPVGTDAIADASPDASPTTAANTPTVVAVPPVLAVSDDGSGMHRDIPDPAVASEAPPIVSPWADRTTTNSNGSVATHIGCASGTSSAELDAFFRERLGPVLGLDYQHVYALGGGRYLWLFQDTFIDYSGLATNLGQATFAHNTALVQDGACFTLYHRGSIEAPTSFEDGTGENWKAKWWWPMGGETIDGEVYVYWAEMEKDGYDPASPHGLGWHPVRTWLAVYSATTLERLAFQPAANQGVSPIYGYAVASDGQYTYLFGNTFEQNLVREGGFANGPHSATQMYLARVPVGQFGADPMYRSGDTWTGDRAAATPIAQRYWAENPMQPRFINGQWVAATKIDGYWGESLAIDVANDPWGPWTTVEQRTLSPRSGDPLMNTYQAHLMPWLDGSGSLVVSASQNARNMRRDAWPNPARYRLMFFRAALVVPPPREDIVATTTTIVEDTTTTDATSTSTESTTTTSTTTPATTPATTPPATPTTTAAPTTTTSPVTTTTVSPTTTTVSPTTTTTVSQETTTTTIDPGSSTTTALSGANG